MEKFTIKSPTKWDHKKWTQAQPLWGHFFTENMWSSRLAHLNFCLGFTKDLSEHGAQHLKRKGNVGGKSHFWGEQSSLEHPQQILQKIKGLQVQYMYKNEKVSSVKLGTHKNLANTLISLAKFRG